MRCASPPERLPAFLSSVIYSNPTSFINCRRYLISLSGVSAISFSCAGRFFKDSKYSMAFSIGRAVTSTILFPFKETARASLRNLFPPHCSQTFSDQTLSVPKPWHASQAPYGLLKEKSLGSISGKEKLSLGHAKRAEKINSCSLVLISLEPL